MVETALVTGGTGFLAQWVIYSLLENGYNVKATVRSESKKSSFEASFGEEIKSGRLQFVIIPDLSAAGALDDSLSDVDYVFSVASPFAFDNIKSLKDDIVDPTISVVEYLFKSVKKSVENGGRVKRVVFTGSMACVITYGPYDGEVVYTEKDFNPATYAQAVDTNDHYFAYCSAKGLAEKRIWELQKDNDSFSVVFLLPPWIFGPSKLPLKTRSSVNESNKIFADLLDKQVTPDAFYEFVDARDLAEAHVAALQPQAANKRFIITGGRFFMNDVVKIARASFQLDLPDIEEPKNYWRIDNSVTAKELGFKPKISLEKSEVDTIEQIKSLPK